MTYTMASIAKKILAGKAYYYARECRRVNGKPKIVWQKYLGRADDIVARLTHPQLPPEACEAICTDFGALAALSDLQLASLKYASVHVPGLAKNARDPEIVDDELPVAQFAQADFGVDAPERAAELIVRFFGHLCHRRVEPQTGFDADRQQIKGVGQCPLDIVLASANLAISSIWPSVSSPAIPSFSQTTLLTPKFSRR